MTEIEFAKLNLPLGPTKTKYKGQYFYSHRVRYIQQNGPIPVGYRVTKEGKLAPFVNTDTYRENILREPSGQYRVQAMRNGKYYWIGRFTTLEGAEMARERFRQKLEHSSLGVQSGQNGLQNELPIPMAQAEPAQAEQLAEPHYRAAETGLVRAEDHDTGIGEGTERP